MNRHRAPPRYLAALPWIGPIQGSTSEERMDLGAATDPLLGEALAAAFLPVRRAGGSFVRAPGSGWAAPINADEGGRFRLEARLEWWQSGIAGILMVLLYDRSSTLYYAGPADGPRGRRRRRPFPDTWAGQLAAYRSTLDPAAMVPIEDLPKRMRMEIEARVAALLEGPAWELEEGLVERDVPPEADQLTFAVASCQYPANFIDGDLAGRSYGRLRACLEARDSALRPRCLLLLGDQVYIDPTAGLFDPAALSDRYDLPYERLLRLPALRHVLRRIPAFATLDDHELEDNWEPGSGDPDSLEKGRRYFFRYQRMASAPPASPERLWQAFTVNGFPFFMADTRTQRQPRRAGNLDSAQILDPQQWEALEAWLEQHAGSDVPKFITSPAAFLPRHRQAINHRAGALRSDAWDGYPASLEALIARIAEGGMRNVVFLSGDEHISFATTALVRRPDGSEAARILSIHSSGLYAPFAFANSSQDSLACDERFSAGAYLCEVTTRFAARGDGFALIRVSKKGGSWDVRCEFDLA